MCKVNVKGLLSPLKFNITFKTVGNNEGKKESLSKSIDR